VVGRTRVLQTFYLSSRCPAGMTSTATGTIPDAFKAVLTFSQAAVLPIYVMGQRQPRFPHSNRLRHAHLPSESRHIAPPSQHSILSAAGYTIAASYTTACYCPHDSDLVLRPYSNNESRLILRVSVVIGGRRLTKTCNMIGRCEQTPLVPRSYHYPAMIKPYTWGPFRGCR
jgi:hypothetical protein